MSTDPRYLTIARSDIGQRETLGPNDSPFLRTVLKRLNLLWLLGQPWCGMVMADWVIRAGLTPPPNAYRALSWAQWGAPCAGPAYGAVAVLTRKGGGHVAIVTAVSADGNWVRLLGGNQDDEVNERWFKADRVTAYRLPAGVVPRPAPVAKVGSFSSTEA